MAAKSKAGATSALAIEIDREAAASWNAYKFLRVLNDEDADGGAKLEAALGYAELVAAVDEDGLVKLTGKDNPQMAEVVEVVAAIIAEASPKN